MPEQVYKSVTVVNERDEIVGAEDMFYAIDNGLIRSCTHIFVFNKSGKILLQRRSRNVFLPLLLDSSSAGHVDEGETRLMAAVRELEEEIGIANHEVIEIEKSFCLPGAMSTIHKVVVADDIQLTLNPEEVEEVLWLTASEISTLIKLEPTKCTPSLVTIWTELADELISK